MERPTTVAHLSSGSVEYRHERRSGDTVVIFHGGHLRAGLPVGEELFEELGYSVLVPSRPGYGRTPVVGRSSPEVFADATAELCEWLGIDRVAAVDAVSAGGRTGLAFARRHPHLAPRLILDSAVGFDPWPDRMTRIGVKVLFNPVSERAVWSMMGEMMRRAPEFGLRSMMSSLSTLPSAEVVDRLTPQERSTLVELFAHMRSGRGFANDVRWSRHALAVDLELPTLVLASAYDGTVPFSQTETSASRIDGATLVVTGAVSHLIWFGPGADETASAVRAFLQEPT